VPTYDYACKRCGHTFEHFQSISDKLLRTCPECKRRSLERLFGTGIGVVFKGSGFYETDYKRKGKPSDEGDKGGSSTSKSKSGETKPAPAGSDKADKSKPGSKAASSSPSAGSDKGGQSGTGAKSGREPRRS